MVSFIDDNREEFGVEPVCKQLQMAPSTYYAAKKRQPSARAIRDALLKSILFVLWTTNRKVYGAHKLWLAAQRSGHGIGRDQVARLMRELGIRGASKCRKKVFTTRSDSDAGRPPDLVKRDFSAAHPNGLWVTDLTYVPTRTGMAYVCFITDAFSRMIVGWRVAAHMRTDMVLDALEMASRSRRAGHFAGLVTHSDAGSQGGINRPSQHPNIGGVRCGIATGRRKSGSIGARSPRRDGRLWPGVRTESDSGAPSLAACSLTTPRPKPASHPPSGTGGSVTLVA
jgi:putative transposase